MSKKLVILGAGESGIGAAILGKEKGYDVLVSDYGLISEETKDFFRKEGIPYEDGGHSGNVFEGDLVVKSPGISDSAKIIIDLLASGVEVVSEVEFAFRFLDKEKVIAITGTNGKTTTTMLTYHLLKTAGFKVAMGGNVGVSLAKLVAQGIYDYYVVEVSSFQLDGIVHFKPDVAVLLNITPDHLDRYENDFSKYVNSKFRITENLTKEECFIYCVDSEPITEELAHRHIESALFAISAAKNEHVAAYLAQDHLIFDYTFKKQSKKEKIPLADISLIGKHNMINTMASVLCALQFEISIEKILRGLKSFKNAPHRLELIAEINGVKYVNDSKATNVDAVYYAIDGIKAPIVWIAGGTDKGNDYTLIQDLVKSRVRHIVAIGKDNAALKKVFGPHIPVVEEESMQKAVRRAKKLAVDGGTVLLSPACASFDRFRNYQDRGNQFKYVVKEIQSSKKVKS